MDFVLFRSYLAKGLVEKLEVVNKKWVRIRLLPGSSADSTVSRFGFWLHWQKELCSFDDILFAQGVLWFNIGSVDSFERNLEHAQLELGTEPVNNVPVIYKNEMEASSFSGLLPTLLIIGFLIYMMRRSAGMMGGGAGGRKGGGLFGGVMNSTAKLINSNEINVRFK